MKKGFIFGVAYTLGVAAASFFIVRNEKRKNKEEMDAFYSDCNNMINMMNDKMSKQSETIANPHVNSSNIVLDNETEKKEEIAEDNGYELISEETFMETESDEVISIAKYNDCIVIDEEVKDLFDLEKLIGKSNYRSLSYLKNDVIYFRNENNNNEIEIVVYNCDYDLNE